MKLPNGWRFEHGRKKPCEHCHGTGETQSDDAMIAPSGRRETVIGFTGANAREYAEAWAPDRCSPERREQLYGTTN